MTLPPQHDDYCVQSGMSGGCPVCHPPAMCRNCGHPVSDHFYTTEQTRTFWCPRCRGCGPHREKEQPVMKHLRVFMVDGRVHHLGIGSEEEALKMFKAAMDNGYTLSLTSGLGNAIMFKGQHITCIQVCEGPIPVEQNC